MKCQDKNFITGSSCQNLANANLQSRLVARKAQASFSTYRDISAGRNKKPSFGFSGMAEVLQGKKMRDFLKFMREKGGDNLASVVGSSVGIGLCRPLIIMADPKILTDGDDTPKNEKIYAASWIATLSAIGIATAILFDKPVQKASEYLTAKILFSGKKEFEDALISIRSDYDSKKTFSQALKRVEDKFNEKSTLPEHESFIEFRKALFGLGQAFEGKVDFDEAERKSREAFSQKHSKDLFSMAKKSVRKALKTDISDSEVVKREFFKKEKLFLETKKIRGFQKGLAFVGLAAVGIVANSFIARYLERGINYFAEKTGKKIPTGSHGKKLTEKQKKHRKRVDTVLLGGIGLASGAWFLEAVSRKTPFKLGQGAISKYIMRKYNELDLKYGVDKKFTRKFTQKISNTLDNVVYSPMRRFTKGEKVTKMLINSDQEGGVWTNSNIVLNGIVRPLLLLPTGKVFPITLEAVNEVMTYALARVGDEVCKKLYKPLAKKLGIQEGQKKLTKGSENLVNHLVKHIVFLGIATGIANNEAAKALIKTMRNYKKKYGIGGDQDKPNNNMKFVMPPSKNIYDLIIKMQETSPFPPEIEKLKLQNANRTA